MNHAGVDGIVDLAFAGVFSLGELPYWDPGVLWNFFVLFGHSQTIRQFNTQIRGGDMGGKRALFGP
ncbi:MAG: hypothetical protein GY811_23435 [Myxococcales bacterium]|nr:hypothetical protein [Myxococcales bacterium]